VWCLSTIISAITRLRNNIQFVIFFDLQKKEDNMSQENIIRAWKDASFRDGLSDVERSLLPENPAGLVQLTENQLSLVAAGWTSPVCTDGGRRCGDF
jgi:mersacidin/lichenicidin family type 2 lantibiotic